MASGRLAGKVALITGATSGLGEAIAHGYAREGAQVALCGRRADLGQQVADAIVGAGGEAVFLPCDVSEGGQVKQLIAQVVERFGSLDIAVNNAGAGASGALLADLSEDEFDRVIGVNLRGVWLCMKYEIQQFLAQGTGGAIINMGSVLGQVALASGASFSAAHYVAAKHGIEGLTKTAAIDYGRSGIRVNTLAPGVIATAISDQHITDEVPMMQLWCATTALGRLGTSSEVVGAAVFLGSTEAAYVTGTTLVVDGGYLAN